MVKTNVIKEAQQKNVVISRKGIKITCSLQFKNVLNRAKTKVTLYFVYTKNK